MSRGALLLSMLALSACDEALYVVEPTTCVSDAECAGQNVCMLGVCVDPRAQALDEVNLEIRPPEQSGHLPQQVFGVKVGPSSEDSRTVVELRETIHVTGNVLDLGDAPVACQVVAIPQAGIPGRALVTSATAGGLEGGFSLPLVAADPERGGDTYRVAVYPDDAHARPPHYLPEPLRATMANAQLGPVFLPDPASLVRVYGKVVTSDGAVRLGVQGLEVRLYDGGRRVSSVGVTAEDGTFAVAVPPDAPERLTLEARPTEQSRMNPLVRREVSVGEGDLVVDLGALAAPVPFTGVVRGPAGEPVPGARIYARSEISSEAETGVLSVVVTAADDGTYDSELRPGRYDIAVVPPPTEPDAGMLVGFSANVSATASPLLNTPARLALSGEVITAEGRPVEGAAVQLTRIGAVLGDEEPVLAGVVWTFSALTDADGRFSARVDPGRYRVVVIPDPASGLPRDTRILDVADDGDSVSLELRPQALIAGQLRAGGSPLAGAAQVTAFSTIVGENGEAFELGSTLSTDDGRFEIVVPDLAVK